MPVFVAYDYSGKVENVVLARSHDLANAYWQGCGIYAHSIKTIDDSALTDHPTGVLPIVSTKEVDPGKFHNTRSGKTKIRLIE